jgi:excisionase family DNA binding protein
VKVRRRRKREDELLSVKELACALGVSVDSIRRAFAKGTLPAFRICKLVRFDLDQVRQAMQVNGFGQALRAGAVRIGDSRPRGRRPRRAPEQ